MCAVGLSDSACLYCQEGAVISTLNSMRCEPLQGTPIPDCQQYIKGSSQKITCRICKNGKMLSSDMMTCSETSPDPNCELTDGTSLTARCVSCKAGFYSTDAKTCGNPVGSLKGCQMGAAGICTECNSFAGFFMTQPGTCTLRSVLLSVASVMVMILFSGI